MTHAYFLTVFGNPEDGAAFREWFGDEPLAKLCGLRNVRAVELFVPEEAHDPYLADEHLPLLMVELDFDGVDDAQRALNSEVFAQAVGDLSHAPVPVSAVAELMEAEAFPVNGRIPERTAPVSYVVRYHRPAEDERAFVAHYREKHPPILARFPGIRYVACYYPVAWHDETEIPAAGYMLGNEVVFDSVEALNAALASDIRHELREDFHTFPPFTGRNTHFAMTRKRAGP